MKSICLQCNLEFEYINKHGKNYKQKFCSLKCANEYKRHWTVCIQCGVRFSWEHKEKGRKSPQFCSQKCHYAHGKITLVCRQCGVSFEVNKSQNNRIFCSVKCRIVGGKDPANRSYFVCKWCGKAFEGWTSRHPTLCSNQCRSEYGASKRAIQLYRPDSIKSRGLNWKSQARKARKRDKYICQTCGRHSYKEHFRMQVHHIIPYRLFNGDYQKANDLSNLVSLCPSCHPKVEAGIIELHINSSAS